MSARSGFGFDELAALVARELPRPEIRMELLLPYNRGDLLSRIHDDGEVLSSEHTGEGTHVHAKVTPTLQADLADFTI